MKRINILILSVVLTIIIPTQAPRADDPKLNIQELYSQCKGKLGSADSLFCIGFISGIGDLMLVNGLGVKPFDNAKYESSCGRPSYGAQVQAFVNWAEKHPDLWDGPRAIGVVEALRESWPCPQNSN
jgi:hypothetical protein